METHFICFLVLYDSMRKIWQCHQLKMNSTGRKLGSIKHLIKLSSFFPICSTHYEMTSTDDEEVGHFIISFSSCPSSSSPPPAAAPTKLF
jgi:hypothetical protein